MLQVSGGKAAAAGILHEQIEELARTVPGVAETAKESETAANRSPGTATTPVAMASQAQRVGPTGVFALISELFSLRRKIGALDESVRLTDSLGQSAKALRYAFRSKDT